MQQENLNTSQKHLMSLLLHFKKRRIIKDDYNNKVMMFFNEDFLTQIFPLINLYTYNHLSKVSKDKRKIVIKKGIVSIKETKKLLENKYKFNVEEFIRYGQARGKDWDYLIASEVEKNKELIPKPKKKFMNPKRRRHHVISK